MNIVKDTETRGGYEWEWTGHRIGYERMVILILAFSGHGSRLSSHLFGLKYIIILLCQRAHTSLRFPARSYSRLMFLII